MNTCTRTTTSSCTWLQRHHVVVTVSDAPDSSRPPQAAQTRLTRPAAVSLHQAAQRSVEPTHTVRRCCVFSGYKALWWFDTSGMENVRGRDSLHDDYVDSVHRHQDDGFPPGTFAHKHRSINTTFI